MLRYLLQMFFLQLKFTKMRLLIIEELSNCDQKFAERPLAYNAEVRCAQYCIGKPYFRRNMNASGICLIRPLCDHSCKSDFL